MTKKKLPNPDIAKAGKKFTKDDPRASEAGKKGAAATNEQKAIRANLRRLGRFQPKEDADGRPIVTFRALKQAFGADTKGKKLLCMSEIWAVLRAQQAAQDFRAMTALIEEHDGKQTEKNLTANVSYAELIAAVDAVEEDE